MADLSAAVRDFARRHGLTAADARQRLLAIGLLLDSTDRTDAAVAAAFIHGCRFEQERVASLIGDWSYPSTPAVAHPGLRLVHSAP